MQYLKIENTGVCPVEGFTVLGVSTTRQAAQTNTNLIGQYGTGNKHGVAVCLRNGIKPVVFCNKLRLDFSTRTQEISDGLITRDFGRVVVKYGGVDSKGINRSSTEDLGFVLEFGATEWQEVSMACREFVSNALDREERETGNWTGVSLEVVDENKVRAKAGTTRVFLPFTSEVAEFYENVGKWFLHFSEPESIGLAVLPKKNRNFGDSKVAVFYRRGVRIREWTDDHQESLFDYNLNDLSLDEARKADDWAVRNAAGKALMRADKTILSKYLGSFTVTQSYWEHGFDKYSLEAPTYDSAEKTAARKANWAAAVEEVAGLEAVVTTQRSVEVIKKRGLKALIVPEAVEQAAATHGVRTPTFMLSADELAGREILEPTSDASAALDLIWQTLCDANMTKEKARPEVKCFRATATDGERVMDSYLRDGVVYVNADMAAEGSQIIGWNALSDRLLVVTMEEVAHYVTDSGNYCRDYQDFLVRLCVVLGRRLAMASV